MKATAFILIASCLSPIIYPAFSHAYGTSEEQEITPTRMIGRTGEHESFVREAYDELCASKQKDAFCKILRANLRYMQFGAYMEDSAAPRYRQTFDNVLFEDEEDAGIYANCSLGDSIDTPRPYCNHFLFIIRKPGEAQNGCGSSFADATKGCSSRGGMQWETASTRGYALYNKAISHLTPQINAHDAGSGSPHLFFWLGRVAHLLADMGVPGHVISHPIDYVEVEHRVYEYMVSFTVRKADYANQPSAISVRTGDFFDLFDGLANYTLGADEAVRGEYLNPHPLKTALVDPENATNRALKSAALTAALLKSDIRTKEMYDDAKIAKQVCRVVKPAVVAYTVKLLEMFRDDPRVRKELDAASHNRGSDPAGTQDPGGYYAAPAEKKDPGGYYQTTTEGVKKDAGSYQAAPPKPIPALNGQGDVVW